MNLIKTYIIILISVFTFYSCSENKQEKMNEEVGFISLELEADTVRISKTYFEENSFSLDELIKENKKNTITATGMIEVPPNGRAVISAKVGGYIKNSQLLVGDQVKKGDYLVSIENIEFLELQQNYLEAMQEMLFLESNFNRQSELYKEKITSEKAFLKAQSDFKRVAAVYAGLKKKLELLNISTKAVENGDFTEKSNIYAPISGDITEINVKTGSYVDTSNPIMEIVNTEHVHLELKIFEKDALQVKKGQRVIFRLPESSEDPFSGTVHLIGKSIGADRTVTAHVHIDEEGSTQFIPGMFVQAEIELEGRSSYYISEDAVLKFDNRYFLYKMLHENKNSFLFERIEITPVTEDNNKIEINDQAEFHEGNRYLSGMK